MRLIIWVNVAMFLFMCVSTSAIIEKRAVESVSQLEGGFVNSLDPQQQKWWTENRQKVFEFLVDLGNTETVKTVNDFIKTLSSEQQALWVKLQNLADQIFTTYKSSPGTYPALGPQPRGVCGGGCISSTQCSNWAGSRGCRCSWFSCGLV